VFVTEMRRSAVRHGPIATARGLAAPPVIAELAAGEATGDGDGTGVDRGAVGVGAALGVREGVGAAQPAIKTQSKASPNVLIVIWTVRVRALLRKADRGSVHV
jgi:hypothetical protein